MYKHFFKRFFDFWIALIALICISPILIVVTIWLHFANKGAGAFFFQERPGKNGKIFKVIKFKTMTDEKDAEGNLVIDPEQAGIIRRIYREYLEGARFLQIKRSLEADGIPNGAGHLKWHENNIHQILTNEK